MKEKIKVLFFVDRMLKGGIQSLVINIAKYIDKEQFQLDFLLLDDGKKYDLEETLKSFNCKIYKLKGVWINTPLDYINYFKKMNKFFKGKEYDIIHLHSSSKNFLVLYFAKKNGIKIRIAHSHNIAFQTKNIFKILTGNILKVLLKKYATDYMACSKEAGIWLFGKNKDVKVLKNEIEINKFLFNEKTRKEIRNKYNILDDEIVCGNVGRLENQKNQQYLISIFNKISKIDSKYKLLLVGQGEQEVELKKLVENYGISNKVIFVGFQENAYEFYNAMDVFLFPSKFEGLGMALIEAQTNGLKCIVSEFIPKEAIITNNVRVISLKHEQKWIKEIIEIDKSRNVNIEDINKSGFNIEQEIENLENYYKRRVER